MSSILQTLMEMVYDSIDTKKIASEYINNDFTLAKAFVPITALPDISDDGQVFVIGLSGDDSRGSRGKFFIREVPIRIAIQKKIDNIFDIDEIYDWCELEDQLRDTVAESDKLFGNPNVTWVRHESLKDENDTPFNYVKMREASVFECYFDSFFRLNLTTS